MEDYKIRLFLLKTRLTNYIESVKPKLVSVGIIEPLSVRSLNDLYGTVTVLDSENKKNIVSVYIPFFLLSDVNSVIEELLKEYGYRYRRSSGIKEIGIVYHEYEKE